MEEAERCNQIAFMSRGRLLAIGSPQELKGKVTGKLLEIECRPLIEFLQINGTPVSTNKCSINYAKFNKKAGQIFQKIPGVVGITAYGTALHLNVLDEDIARREIVETAQKYSIEILSIKPIAASLEDVFAALDRPAVH